MIQASLMIENNCLMVSGELTFLTVPILFKNSLSLLPKLSHFNIDLSRVTVTKSAALALFIEWIKLARKQKKQIKFFHIPLQLLTVAELSGLSHYFRD